MPKTQAVKVMVPVNVIAAIDEQVEKRNFTGRADFALYAIRFYLDKIKEDESRTG